MNDDEISELARAEFVDEAFRRSAAIDEIEPILQVSAPAAAMMYAIRKLLAKGCTRELFQKTVMRLWDTTAELIAAGRNPAQELLDAGVHIRAERKPRAVVQCLCEACQRERDAELN